MLDGWIVTETLDPVTLTRKVVIAERTSQLHRDRVHRAVLLLAALGFVGACLM